MKITYNIVYTKGADDKVKITRTFYNVGGKLVTERELNAAKKVVPDIEAVEETYSLEMSIEEFMNKAEKVEKDEV